MNLRIVKYVKVNLWKILFHLKISHNSQKVHEKGKSNVISVTF
ncbi:conserved protein of unknown function [Limnospira indica PCC 8005]|uniref:Uncharacterized protein n=1 Tax=Limnospira indica PCC 8005 TaxID=376219 RepID=A0A9P1P260_9CYAN|nr:conserved protein of unknown function [Limnospira indica PCC 8005]